MAESNTPAKIEDVIAAKIRVQFIELIPEESFKLMVQTAIRDFTAQPSRTYSGDPIRPSPLERIILDEIKARFVDKVKTAMDAPEFNGMWEANALGPSEFVKGTIKELAPELIQALFGGLMQNAVQMMRNNLAQIR